MEKQKQNKTNTKKQKTNKQIKKPIKLHGLFSTGKKD